MVWRFSVVLVAACAGSACVSTPSGPPPENFVGHVTASDTGNWFVACSSSSATPIRLTFADNAVVQFTTAKSTGHFATGRKSFVRLRGVLAQDGAGSTIAVSLIQQVRPENPKDCANE